MTRWSGRPAATARGQRGGQRGAQAAHRGTAGRRDGPELARRAGTRRDAHPDRPSLAHERDIARSSRVVAARNANQGSMELSIGQPDRAGAGPQWRALRTARDMTAGKPLLDVGPGVHRESPFRRPNPVRPGKTTSQIEEFPSPLQALWPSAPQSIQRGLWPNSGAAKWTLRRRPYVLLVLRDGNKRCAAATTFDPNYPLTASRTSPWRP